ncbi:MAG: S8 family serine peptidase, partial [Actinobacteria bacterium]|nr:S8 family serine peptidase [Actinomycetota bacterium]
QEQAASDYAYRKGAVVVAAVGNGAESPATPWPYADYPAALPHVIGVGAYGRHGGVPTFSNRDARYVDLVAPGVDIFSTIPRNLVSLATPRCLGVAYSSCGPSAFRDAIGTSFAAPQVSAAAALLIGEDPKLAPNQVIWLLERTAADATAKTGCALCSKGRDAYSGWGYLNIDAALTALADEQVPPPDRLTVGDAPGSRTELIEPPRVIQATLDY